MKKSLFKQLWRGSGATAAGVLLSHLAESEWGMLVTPVLMGISKMIKKYYQLRNKPTPDWVEILPF